MCDHTRPCGCLFSSWVISTRFGLRGPKPGKETWSHPPHAPSLRVLQRPRPWYHPRVPPVQGISQSPAWLPSVQPGQGSAPDLSVQCQLDTTRDQAGSTWGPALPANSIPAQSSLLARRPPVGRQNLESSAVQKQPISPPVPCRQPALRSQQPRSAVNRFLDYPHPTSSKGCWDSLQRIVPVLVAMDHIL